MSKQAMEMALEALEEAVDYFSMPGVVFNKIAAEETIAALKAAIKQHDADPVAWHPIETLKQSDGAVILYSEDWVDEDFNPTGTRDGFRNENDTGPIYSAVWNPCQDCWDTCEDSAPTHWMPLPAFPQFMG